MDSGRNNKSDTRDESLYELYRAMRQKAFEIKENPDFRINGNPGEIGAGNVTRTHDLLITNQLLYRLSYTSMYTFFDQRRLV